MKTFYLFFALLTSCTHGPLVIENEKRLPSPFSAGFSRSVVTDSVPAFHEKNIYYGSAKGKVYAVEASSDKVLWKAKVEGSVNTSPQVAFGKVFVGTSKGFCYALSATDGKEVWKKEVSAEIIGSMSAMEPATILMGTNDGTLYALDAQNGNVRWRYRRPIPERITIRSFATPNVAADRIYAGFSDGSLVALHSKDGEEIWRQTFPVRERFPDVVAPIVSQGNMLVATQFFGTLYAIDPKGTILWTKEEGGSSAAPIFSKDRMFVPAANSTLYSLDAKTGNKKWELVLPHSANWGGLAISQDRLYATSYEGVLYVVEVETGKLIWHYKFTSAIQGEPIIHEDRIHLVTRRGELFTLAKKR